MISKDKGIKKKLLDWLWSAISTNEFQFIHIGDDSAVATDSIRMHAINVDGLPEHIHGLSCVELLKGECSSSFFINPKYLIDALSGFVPSENGVVHIQLIGNIVKDNKRVVIGDKSDNVAVVMCCKHEGR